MYKNLKTVLIFDGSSIASGKIQKFLLSRGYDVDNIQTANELISAVNDQKTAALLLDIRKVEEARSVLESGKIPVIFLAGDEDSAFIAKTEQLTSYGYIGRDNLMLIGAAVRSAIKLAEVYRKNERTPFSSIINRESQLRHYIESAPCGIFLCNSKGQILDYNRIIENITGRSRADLNGMLITDLFTDEEKPPVSAAIRRMLSDEKISERFKFSSAEGQILYLRLDAVRLSDDRYLGFVVDITEQSIMAENLRNSEIRYKELVENLASGVAIYKAVDNGEDFIINEFNKAGERIENCSREDLIGKKVTEAFPGVTDFGLLDVMKEVYNTGVPRSHPVSFYKDEHIAGWRENYVYRLPAGEIVAIYEDKTKQMLEHEALKYSEKQLRNVLETVKMIAISIDSRGNIVFCNDFFLNMTGWTREEVLNRNYFKIFLPPEEADTVYNELFLPAVYDCSFPKKIESDIITKKGQRRIISWNNTLFCDNCNRIIEITGLGEDITEKKQIENQREKNLNEKDLILKEVHHRIKNNMSTIKSLLLLQAETVDEENARKALRDAGGRLNSMMILYDKLYSSEENRVITAPSYVESLVYHIVTTFPHKVSIQTEIDRITLPVSTAATLGIIVNEVITNAMKYAFNEDAEHQLLFSLKKTAGGFAIVIHDNGPGFIPEKGARGFGLTLIDELTRQLKGNYNIKSDCGTRYEFDFSHL